MPFDGQGGYSAPVNSWNPAVSQTVIDPADWNSTQSDYETALSNVICKDGQTNPTANLPMAGFRHTGVNTNSGNASRSEYVSGATFQDGAPLDAGETGGTSTAYTASLTPAITAYADKQCFRVKFDQACGAGPTINFNSVGAKKIYKNVSGTPVQLEAADVPDDYVAFLRYDSTLDSNAGGFLLLNLPLSAGIITPVELASASISEITNLTLEATVGSNALTIAIKGQDGNDPSATNPVKIPFADQAGGVSVLSITAATSLTVSSGSTLGTTSGVESRLWVVGFDDGGTFRLGVVNADLGSGVFLLTEDNVYSATAEGGAGGADSAGVIYSDAAITDKPIRILGYVKSTQATAGTWATAPSNVIVCFVKSNAILFTDYESPEQAITLGSPITVSHGLGGVPRSVLVTLRCITANNNFSVGDEVVVPTQNFDNTNYVGVMVGFNATDVFVIPKTLILVFDKSTSAQVIMTAPALTNWRIVIRAAR